MFMFIRYIVLGLERKAFVLINKKPCAGRAREIEKGVGMKFTVFGRWKRNL